MSFDDLVSDKFQQNIEDFEELSKKTDHFIETLKETMIDTVDDITSRYKKALDVLLDDCKDLQDENLRVKQILNQHNIPHTTVEVI